MPFAGHEAGGRVEADPAGAGQVDLGPGVEIGEVARGARRTLDRLLVGHELDEVAGDEARREAEMAQQVHQHPGRIAAGAGRAAQRLFRGPDAGFQPHDIGDAPGQHAVDLDQQVDGLLGLGRDAGEHAQKLGPGKARLTIGRQLLFEDRIVGEGEGLRLGLEEEVERVDGRHVGDEIDDDLELGHLLGEDDAGLEVPLRILLPVEEVRFGRDRQRIGEDRRAGMRRGTQPDGLRAEGDQPVIAIAGAMGQGSVDRHGAGLFLASGGQAQSGSCGTCLTTRSGSMAGMKSPS